MKEHIDKSNIIGHRHEDADHTSLPRQEVPDICFRPFQGTSEMGLSSGNGWVLETTLTKFLETRKGHIYYLEIM